MKTIQYYIGIVYQYSQDGKFRFDLYSTDVFPTEERVLDSLKESKDEILELFERNECRAYENATQEEREQLFAKMLEELWSFRLRFPKQLIDGDFEDVSVKVIPVTVHLS